MRSRSPCFGDRRTLAPADLGAATSVNRATTAVVESALHVDAAQALASCAYGGRALHGPSAARERWADDVLALPG